jgi:hypothetical protein
MLQKSEMTGKPQGVLGQKQKKTEENTELN